jgi:hypothetical protein
MSRTCGLSQKTYGLSILSQKFTVNVYPSVASFQCDQNIGNKNCPIDEKDAKATVVELKNFPNLHQS